MRLRCSPGECKTAEVDAREQPVARPFGVRTRATAQPDMGTCPLSSTCTRTGALGTRTRAFAPPITNNGTACSTRWTTSARGGRNTPRTTRSTSDEMSPLDRRLACITNTTSNQPLSFPWSRPAEASSSPPSPPRYRTASSSTPSPYSRPWRQPPARTTASPHSRWTPRHHP